MKHAKRMAVCLDASWGKLPGEQLTRGANSVRKSKYDLYNDYIKVARKNKIPIAHIAKYLNVSEKVIRKRCKEYGLQGDGVLDNLNDEEDIKARVEKKAPGFEYVSGYIGIERPATIRCKTCGTITRRNMEFLKEKHTAPVCKYCQKVKLEEKRKQQQAERNRQKELKKQEQKQQRKQKEMDDMLNNKGTQLSMRACEKCNKLFIPRRDRQRCCSSACGDKLWDALKKDRRIRKMRQVVIDKNITLEGLYKRDNGLCWICGQPCDYSAEINANNYPSIDHVKPLAKGGKHSWDNVRLAHRICNSIKSDRTIETGT